MCYFDDRAVCSWTCCIQSVIQVFKKEQEKDEVEEEGKEEEDDDEYMKSFILGLSNI